MEEILEQAADCSCVGNGGFGKPEALTTGVVAAVCLVGGAAIGTYFAKRYFQKKYETLAIKEIAEAKAHYAQRNKAEPYDTPGNALEALSERGKDAAEAVLSYQGKNVDREDDGEMTVTDEETVIEHKNIFTESSSNMVEWNQDQEQSKRDAHPEDPYILNQDEYMENEPDYQQVSLTYYAEDDVLADEKDQPIPPGSIDDVVGEDNLTRFGHGSRDNRMLYIRNDRIQMAFEVVKNEGSYAQQVAGFIEHSDTPRVRKMRGDRD